MKWYILPLLACLLLSCSAAPKYVDPKFSGDRTWRILPAGKAITPPGPVATTTTVTEKAPPVKLGPPLPAGDRARVFIHDFSVSVPSALGKKTELAAMPSVLAAETQTALQTTGRFTPLTLSNLQDQLKKERMKEVMACSDEKCVSRIIENFGVSDSIFGVVRQLSPKMLHINLTYIRGETVLAATSTTCEASINALLKSVQSQVLRLAALTQ
jgi:hypothetical protein